MTVVCDTSVLCYLALTDYLAILPRRFGNVTIPGEVAEECLHPHAPIALQALVRNPPEWLKIAPTNADRLAGCERLDRGEAAAIALANRQCADLVLIDERVGRQIAADSGLAVAGTLGLLAEAAGRGWLDFDAAIARLLSSTNFRVTREVVDQLRRSVGSGAPD